MSEFTPLHDPIALFGWLPLAVEPPTHPPPIQKEMDWEEMKLLLGILEELPPTLLYMEPFRKRLDLSLRWLAHMVSQQRPALHAAPVSLTADKVRWQSLHASKVNQVHRMWLQIEGRLPAPIPLWVEILESVSLPGGVWQLTARLLLEEDGRDALSKQLFKHHREHIRARVT